MKKCTLFFVILFAIYSCQIKLNDYVNKQSQSFLSFEGGINDKVERQIIRLFSTSEKIDGAIILTPVSGAKIFVSDEKGTKINYFENENGIYKTIDKVAGIPNRIYTLHMDIGGKLYESTPEILPTCPEIDKIYDEGTIKENLPESNNTYGGFDVYLNFKDSPEKGNFYRWTWKHFSRIDLCAICEGTSWDDVKGACADRDKYFFGTLINRKQHCRTNCFDISLSTDFNLLADDYINGQKVEKIFITRVPFLLNQNDISRYKYFLEIEQRAINKDTYKLFKQLKETQNSGSLFDVPTLTQFNLNITCTNDPSQKIIGIFEVYGSKVKPYFVDLSREISGTKAKFIFPSEADKDCFPSPCTIPCIEGLFRTKTAPDGWKD